MEKSQIGQDLEELLKSTDSTAETDTNTSTTEPTETSTEEVKEEVEEVKPVENTEEPAPTEATEEPKEEVKSTEPEESAEEKTVEEEKPAELILGKFKTVEDLQNAYTNLEKQYSKKSQQVSEVAKVSDSSEFDKMVGQEISKAGWDLVNKAMQTITDPEQLKEATFALEQYRRTGDGALLEKARGFLSPRTDRQLEVDFMNASAAIKQEANRYRDEIELQPVRESLEALEKEDPDWLNDQTHQDILVAAIKLNKRVDVREIKKMISDIEKKTEERVLNRERKKMAQQAEKKATVSVKTAERVDPPAPKKEWYNMSIEEQLKEEFKNM
ncbi:MAG: hypothetical protein MJ156_00400 [Alphaproteobacteria bacterium]|nr:hypothetical protein [Alphaproteobacteria bacterium]